MSARLSCIWAMSEDGVIGRDGDLPWRLSADLKRFRRLTTGHTIIMGRRTWESIGRPLPERRNIVLSREPGFEAPGAEVFSSLDRALESVSEDDVAFVIGGRAVYEAAIGKSDSLFVTLVHARLSREDDGDVRLPEDVLTGWEMISDESHAADDRNEYDYSFRIYEKVDQTVKGR